MKRSEINREILHAIDFLDHHSFTLPPFADWSPQQWEQVGPEANEIRSRQLGWDVTDFNRGRFRELGLTIFTIRNGKVDDPANRKVYAEKVLIVKEQQITPYHFHFSKTEDIINRGGGKLLIQVCNSDDQQSLADTPVTVSCDGVERTVPAGGTIELETGQSITLVPGVYHEFTAAAGSGTVLVGEVSSVNDDNIDNRFLQELPRFPIIDQDEPPVRLLCTEYPEAKH
jgi:D-lyxose ketol-isomerase